MSSILTDATTKGIRKLLKEWSRCLVSSDEGANTFEGGGTLFESARAVDAPSLAAAAATHVSSTALGALVRPARGALVSHFGGLRHAGVAVTAGTRYLLAGFVRVEALAREEWRVLHAPD